MEQERAGEQKIMDCNPYFILFFAICIIVFCLFVCFCWERFAAREKPAAENIHTIHKIFRLAQFQGFTFLLLATWLLKHSRWV